MKGSREHIYFQLDGGSWIVSILCNTQLHIANDITAERIFMFFGLESEQRVEPIL